MHIDIILPVGPDYVQTIDAFASVNDPKHI
jgi:hypothetical protein